MRPKWPKLASLAQKICTLWFQLFDAFFASKGYPFKNVFKNQTSFVIQTEFEESAIPTSPKIFLTYLSR